MRKALFFIPVIIFGLALYLYCFFKGGEYSTFLMPIGGLIAAVALLMFGIAVTRKEERSSSKIIPVASMFIMVLLFYMLAGVMAMEEPKEGGTAIKFLKDNFIFIILPLFWDTMVFFGYLFPHFSLHLFGNHQLAINDSFFTGNCDHTEKDIREYKEERLAVLQVSLIITGMIAIGYIIAAVKKLL